MELTKLGFDAAIIESKYKWNLVNTDWIPFLNHGFFDENLNIELDEKDQVFKYMFQLYDHLIHVSNVDLNDKVVLDIGCGYGKGISYLKKKYNFAKAYGLDLIPQHISAAENEYKDVKYFTFDARNLNLLDLKVDMVTSVESLCYYPDCDNFYIGLKKILNDGGIAIVTTVLNRVTLSVVYNKFKEHNFNILNVIDVTENVWKGCFLQYKLFEDIKNIQKVFNVSEKRIRFEQKILNDSIKAYRNRESLYFTFYVKKMHV